MAKINAEKFFLQKFDFTKTKLEKAVDRVLGKPIEYADIYFEHTTREFIKLEDSDIKEVSGAISQGAGVRAIAGEMTGFAYSDEITLKQLKNDAAFARLVAKSAAPSGALQIVSPTKKIRNLYALKKKPIDVFSENKSKLCHLVDEICRAYDPRIKKVFVSFFAEDKKILVISKDGRMVGDSRPLVRLDVQCIASEGGRSEIGHCGGGGRVEYSFFLGGERYKEYAEEAARQAIFNLSAKEAPAGLMNVVLGPGWPGILLHEAIGHGLEGDFNRKRTSAFTDRIGARVASDVCTVVDDGTIPNRRGSLNVDDEGTPTQRNILIRNGVLEMYMQDLQNANLMGVKPTGNGRRESYAFQPMPRMTNTFMLPGEASPDDIIRSVKNGLYAKQFGGGQVDIVTGKFVFSSTEAYLIEDGKITCPVRGATLIGNGKDALSEISMVGSDLSLDPGIGTCGKDGQSVPVGVGLPTIKINKMTVGGTKPVAKGGSAK